MIFRRISRKSKKRPAHQAPALIFYILFVLQPLIRLDGQVGSEALEALNHGDQQDDSQQHDEVFVTVVAVVDGDLTKPAAADDAAHGRIA